MVNSGFIEPPPGLFGDRRVADTVAPEAPGSQPEFPAPSWAHPPVERLDTMGTSDEPGRPTTADGRGPAAQMPPAAGHPGTGPTDHVGAAEPDSPPSPAAAEPSRRASIFGELPPFPRFDERLLPAPSGEQASDAPSASAARAWMLGLPDGGTFAVDAPVVLGRNPSAEQFPHIAVRALHDPTRTMSKTHASFLVEHGSLLVDDLNSTNGVALLPAGEVARAVPVEPGRPVEVRAGDVVQLGEYAISVRRS